MVDDATLNIMKRLTPDQRTALMALGSPVSFAPAQTIFFEGQPAHSVLLIQQGNVKVTQVAPDGEEIMLAVRGTDEVMGDEAVLARDVRSATVTTMSDVSGLDIRADDLRQFVDDNQLWPVMYQAVVQRRRQSDQQTMLARHDVKTRLARFLLQLAASVGKQVKDGWAIEVQLSQKDLAGRIGASRETVAIALRSLREQGLLRTGRQQVVVHDLDALREISST